MGCGGVGWSRVPEIQIEAVVGHRRDVEARIRLDNGAQDVMESESAFECTMRIGVGGHDSADGWM